jgi:hypothetical protein
MTKQQLLQIIQEELELVLLERCQKGYKTHPKRKTKKMYGKTYRNCIKAKEALELDEEDLLDEESLHKWFQDGGWRQAGGKYDGKPCAKQPGQKTKPKCVSRKKYRSMSKKQRKSAGDRKRRKDKNPNRRGKPINVNTDPKRKKKKSKKGKKS